MFHVGGTDPNGIYIYRCHHFGSGGPDGTPRPIVTVFVQGKENILKNARHLA